VLLGGGDPGGIDTRVRRFDDMTFGPFLPSMAQVPIELIMLTLQSCEPITVRYCNGQPNESWNVSVDLSPAPMPPPGQITVTKTHANGGTFESTFFVQPKFTFTRGSDGAMRVLDTGSLGIPPVMLHSTEPAPWVHQANPGVLLQPACGVNFVPGIQEANQGTTCVSPVQCARPVGHAGPGHLHVTGVIAEPCPCGACCLAGACSESVTESGCAAQSGYYFGTDSTCPSGGCCTLDSHCLALGGEVCSNGVCVCGAGLTRCGGDACTAPDNGGTAVFPPASCSNGYEWPETPLLVEGLPPGEPVLGTLGRMEVSNVSESPAPGAGTDSFFDIEYRIDLVGTGSNCGYRRQVTIACPMAECTAQPRTPGAEVQSFDTELLSLTGQLPDGDPDFDLLRITAGTNFGMPSPGHTTLTALPVGSGHVWAVDSFFDIEYRIDFIGHSPGPLAGHMGSTTATIRMSAGHGCANLQSDPDRCGSCDTACGQGASCVAGVCVLPQPGGCCLPSGCVVTTSAECGAQGGYFYGEGTGCPNCDDGIACTADACNPLSGLCEHAPDDAACDDGNACTQDSCSPMTGCVNDPGPLNGSACDDGNACTANDVCSAGMCAGTPIDCNPPVCAACPANTLYLETNPVGGCQGDAGDVLEIKLWMLHLSMPVTGFQAFLSFDDALLDYLPGSSSYTAWPFPIHVGTIASAYSGTGHLDLNGSAPVNSAGTSSDALLATLRFSIVSGCASTSVDFRPNPPFLSELSSQGNPVVTALVGTGSFFLDNTAPTINGPGNIVVNADAGDCSAVVNYSVTASDACDSDVTPMCAPASGSTFGPGTTTVNCSATDDCGNTTNQSFTVTVNTVNSVSATVVLEGVNAGSGTISRCIKFIAKNGASCAPPVYRTMSFSGNPATGTDTFEVPCGEWTSLCAKDEQHTLYDTQALSVSGNTSSTVSPLVLLGGDTDNDSDVDINDLTFLMFHFGELAVPQACAWSPAIRDADFSDNGAMGSDDFSILSANWLQFSTCDCAAGSSQPPPMQVRTRELQPEVAAAVDLNGDGWVDDKDVKLFETRHGLPHTLSAKMKAATGARSR
jgi:hypothetical protein